MVSCPRALHPSGCGRAPRIDDPSEAVEAQGSAVGCALRVRGAARCRSAPTTDEGSSDRAMDRLDGRPCWHELLHGSGLVRAGGREAPMWHRSDGPDQELVADELDAVVVAF